MDLCFLSREFFTQFKQHLLCSLSLQCTAFASLLAPTQQGGNFHLKVGGAKSSGNAGDPMLGVAVSGGSRIYKRGGHKIMDACCLYDHSFIV